MPDSALERTVALIGLKTTELEDCWKVRNIDRMTVLIEEITQLTAQLELDDIGEDDA